MLKLLTSVHPAVWPVTTWSVMWLGDESSVPASTGWSARMNRPQQTPRTKVKDKLYQETFRDENECLMPGGRCLSIKSARATWDQIQAHLGPQQSTQDLWLVHMQLGIELLNIKEQTAGPLAWHWPHMCSRQVRQAQQIFSRRVGSRPWKERWTPYPWARETLVTVFSTFCLHCFGARWACLGECYLNVH